MQEKYFFAQGMKKSSQTIKKSSHLHHLGLFCHYLSNIFKYICKNENADGVKKLTENSFNY